MARRAMARKRCCGIAQRLENLEMEQDWSTGRLAIGPLLIRQYRGEHRGLYYRRTRKSCCQS